MQITIGDNADLFRASGVVRCGSRAYRIICRSNEGSNKDLMKDLLKDQYRV
jgi:hypothetical protein